MTTAVKLSELINGNSSQIVVPSGGVNFGTGTDGTGTVTGGVLDDYEEGTWTPNFNNLTIGYGSVWGRYTKIGNVVTVYCGFEFGSNSSFGGTMNSISGLPFGIPSYTSAGGGEAAVNAVGYILDRLNTNYPMIGIGAETGASIVGIIRTDTRAGINATSPMEWANEDTFSITMVYQV